MSPNKSAEAIIDRTTYSPADFKGWILFLFHLSAENLRLP
jgi:hypothetical protein